MAYQRPAPRGATTVEPGIWQTRQGKYICAVCGSGNWLLDNMRRHIAEPHHPCPYCHEAFVTLGAHTWKCPHREAVETPRSTP